MPKAKKQRAIANGRVEGFFHAFMLHENNKYFEKEGTTYVRDVGGETKRIWFDYDAQIVSVEKDDGVIGWDFHLAHPTRLYVEYSMPSIYTTAHGTYDTMMYRFLHILK